MPRFPLASLTLAATLTLPAATAALAQPATATPAANPAAAAAPAEIDLTTWQTGDIDALPDDDYGRMVRYGFRLATETYAVIGPEVADEAMRYSGNNLACTSCHQENATKPYAMPWTGVSAVFPQYRGRENSLQSVENRVNGCMERSMNGKALPVDSPEMRGFTAYIHFLSRGIPVGASIKGAGVERVPSPNRAADPAAGKAVFAQHCVACHGDEGMGQRAGEAGDAHGYAFPPVMGADSYNDGAGMYRVQMAYRFVLNNMPQGADHTARQLTEDEAYDVAAYINSAPRPHKAGMEQDFPDLLRKSPDMPFPPFAGDFPAEQHKYGPFKPIADYLAAELKARSAQPSAAP